GTIQRRLAWPLHKDDTLLQSGRPTGLNIYFVPFVLQPLNELYCRTNVRKHVPYHVAQDGAQVARDECA
ncbi:hypothetical protein PENSPDRAFT_589582, partial [Peniophora sp. CONT]